jgi:hypothetical protein
MTTAAFAAFILAVIILREAQLRSQLSFTGAHGELADTRRGQKVKARCHAGDSHFEDFMWLCGTVLRSAFAPDKPRRLHYILNDTSAVPAG